MRCYFSLFLVFVDDPMFWKCAFFLIKQRNRSSPRNRQTHQYHNPTFNFYSVGADFTGEENKNLVYSFQSLFA
jgi:hypothetical protein